MRPVFLRRGVAAATLVSALAVLNCATPADAWPRRPAPTTVQRPAPPPTPPSIALNSGVVQAAAAYQGYMRQATSQHGGFTQGDQIQVSLQQSEAYEPKQLARGIVAYAAIVALQEPSFVTGVRTYAVDPAGRADMINRIMSDPAYAAQLPGAQAAANMIVARLSADGEALHAAGSSVKQSAYDIQRQSWSKEFVKDREGRLAIAKQLSTVPAVASSEDSAILTRAALTGSGLPMSGMSSAASGPPYTQTVIRGLAVAALAALGAAGDDNASQIDALLNEGDGPYCFSMSKLNLYQCLAVAKPHFEDVFCLGQHALMDTGRCVQKVAGTAPHEQTTVERMMAAREASANGKPVAAIGRPYADLDKKPVKKKAPAKKAVAKKKK